MNPVQKQVNELSTPATYQWVTLAELATILRRIAGDIEPRASLIAGRPVSDTTKAAAKGIMKSTTALAAIADQLEAI